MILLGAEEVAGSKRTIGLLTRCHELLDGRRDDFALLYPISIGVEGEDSHARIAHSEVALQHREEHFSLADNEVGGELCDNVLHRHTASCHSHTQRLGHEQL